MIKYSGGRDRRKKYHDKEAEAVYSNGSIYYGPFRAGTREGRGYLELSSGGVLIFYS